MAFIAEAGNRDLRQDIYNSRNYMAFIAGGEVESADAHLQ